MKRFRVLLDTPAKKQLLGELQWWGENTQSLELLKREYRAALAILGRMPNAGSVVTPQLYRYLLRRTQFHLYYEVDEAARVVHIVAVWHTARGSGPPL